MIAFTRDIMSATAVNATTIIPRDTAILSHLFSILRIRPNSPIAFIMYTVPDMTATDTKAKRTNHIKNIPPSHQFCF